MSEYPNPHLQRLATPLARLAGQLSGVGGRIGEHYQNLICPGGEGSVLGWALRRVSEAQGREIGVLKVAGVDKCNHCVISGCPFKLDSESRPNSCEPSTIQALANQNPKLKRGRHLVVLQFLGGDASGARFLNRSLTRQGVSFDVAAWSARFRPSVYRINGVLPEGVGLYTGQDSHDDLVRQTLLSNFAADVNPSQLPQDHQDPRLVSLLEELDLVAQTAANSPQGVLQAA